MSGCPRKPEPQRVTRLAGRIREHDLLELAALVGRMERQAAEGTGLAETDRAFHATLYRGLGNVLPGEVPGAFRDAFHQVRTALVELPQGLEVTCLQHREILDAVSSGGSACSECATRERFDTIRARTGPIQQFSTNRRPN